MANMTRKEFLKKRIILELLREQGYPTYAKLLDMFSLHLTKDPNVVAYMDPKNYKIVVNDDLDKESVSTVIRHEILHEYFTHFAREQLWHEKNKNKHIDHHTVNVAADYDISNKGYTDSDKHIVRTLTINNRVMRGLVTEDDRPDLVDKSFEEMLDVLSEDEQKLQQQMKQEIQQNQDQGQGQDQQQSQGSGQSDQQPQSENGQQDKSDSQSGNKSDSNDGGNDDHKPGQIGYRGDKETREKEEAERQAQIEKEIADGTNLDSEDEETPEEKISRIAKAFDDLSQNGTSSDLIREINTNKQKENVAKRAKDLARYNESNIRKFEISFSNFLKNAMGLSRGKTWGRVNKTYSDTDLLKKGLSRRRPNKIPSVNVYFDRSGSWDASKTKKGYEIISTFNNYIKQGRLKIDLFYFSRYVHSDEDSAKAEGSTYGQPILNHILETKPDNVVIMTDDDITDCEGRVTVPGAVWLLFVPSGSRSTARSQNLIDNIRGEILTEIYDIETY